MRKMQNEQELNEEKVHRKYTMQDLSCFYSISCEKSTRKVHNVRLISLLFNQL